MTQSEYQITQQAFEIIRELASMCATSGVEIETQKQANDGIRKLISGPIAKAITKLNATSQGIVGV